MARTVTLRPWQKTALEHLTATVSPDFLAVATPGPGVGRLVRWTRGTRGQKSFLSNAAKIRLIAHHTGMSHAEVNAELNRVSGLRKISEASVEQLEKRLHRAELRLRQASARRVPG